MDQGKARRTFIERLASRWTGGSGRILGHWAKKKNNLGQICYDRITRKGGVVIEANLSTRRAGEPLAPQRKRPENL